MRIKIVLIGKNNVGKTALLTRWTEDKFEPSTLSSTLGISYKFQPIELNEENHEIYVWDTPGNELEKENVTTQCITANLIILTYDITDKNSFNYIIEWYSQLKLRAKRVPFILVGCKQDLDSNRQVQISEAKDFSEKYKIFFSETSSNSAYGIEEIFEEALNLSINPPKIEYNVPKQDPIENTNNNQQETVSNDGACCKII